MKTHLAWLGLAGLGCLFAACKVGQASFPPADTMNARSMEHIRPLAAYAMHCNADSLTFTPLAKDSEHPGYVTQYGVDGCGTRMIYVHLYGSDWVANVADDAHVQ